MPSLKRRFACWIALLLVVALGAVGCTDVAQPVAVEPTVAATSAPGDDASTSTSGDDAPTPTADASPATEAGPVDENLAGIFELDAGEQIEDEQGNLVAIYGVSTWPDAYAAVDPFKDDEIDLFGGLEQEWTEPGALVALDVGICAPGVTAEPPGGSAEFFVSASATAAIPTDRSTSGASNSPIPIVEPALRFPDTAECSRGWLPVAWEGGADPAVARYLLSVRSPGASETERYLYQWQITPGSLPDRDDGFGADELVTFNDGDLAGTTVTFGGWAEFVGSESPIDGTRIVGISLEVCPAGDEWPMFGLAVDGWNLASQLSPGNRLGAEAGESRDCYDGWLEFVVPLGGLPTGFFAADGVDPVAGFAGWSLADAALASPWTRHMTRRRWLGAAVLATTMVAVACSSKPPQPDAVVADADVDVDGAAAVTIRPPATTAPLAVPTIVPTPAPTPTPAFTGWVDPETVGENVGTTDGLLTFRGNPTRTFYGRGPVPESPEVQWRFGGGEELCSWSTVGNETTKWCGTGWTGQPAVFDYDDRRWVVFGSYAPAVHFLDASTGQRIIADLGVGDLIKGSVTIDPDGFPLVYFGSRDGLFRVVSFDGASPVELWQLSADAVEPTLWNDDWDGSAIVVDDHLFVGGENSNLHIVRLNRSTGPDGLVQVDPELIFHAPGWDDRLLSDVGDTNVSIETAITIFGDMLWFANSGGLVQAWDIGGLRDGIDPKRVFRFWTGDDVDASIVIDADGYAYVGVELERAFSRGVELGQLIKLDPTRPDDPVVWSRDLHVRVPDGVWATPALHRDVLYVPTNEGNLHAIDRLTGETRWQVKLPGPVWSSPVVVDDVLIQADCSGTLHAWDVADTLRDPQKLWTIGLPWCIESTPAVWEGQIFVGHRRGEFWAIGDPS